MQISTFVVSFGDFYIRIVFLQIVFLFEIVFGKIYTLRNIYCNTQLLSFRPVWECYLLLTSVLLNDCSESHIVEETADLEVLNGFICSILDAMIRYLFLSGMSSVLCIGYLAFYCYSSFNLFMFTNHYRSV